MTVDTKRLRVIHDSYWSGAGVRNEERDEYRRGVLALVKENERLREHLTDANNVITNQKRALDWAAEAANQKSSVHGSERR